MLDSESGCFWMDVTSTSNQYPTDFAGGSTATIGNGSLQKTAPPVSLASFPINPNTIPGSRVIIYGILVTGNAAGGTITLSQSDGTTVLRTVVVPATQIVGNFISFGPRGMECPYIMDIGSGVNLAGFGAKTSVGTLTGSIYFSCNS